MSVQTSHHQATDAYLGYVHQGNYALIVLLDAGDDDAVSVETEDDVVLEGRTPTLHQLKHSLEPKTPLTIKDIGFWKTLRIWTGYAAELDKTSFVFVTCARIKEEDPLSSLTEKGNDRSAVVQALRNEAERVTRAVASAKEEGTSLPYQDKYPGCRAFLNLKKRTQEQLVDRIVVVPESFNAGQLREELAKRLNKVTPVDVREALYSRVEAWWDRQVALSLLGQRTRHITKRELLSQINHLTIELGEASLPDDYSERTPDEKDLAEELGGIMEKQIRLVRGGEGRVMRAAKARWRARNQRERWMQERLANASLLDQFDDRLVDEWEGLYGPMCDDTGDQDEERCCQAGVGLLDWSHKEAPNSVAPVKPDWQHPYLVRGSYQQLAEEMRVGWLPGYERHPALQEDE